jgi:hypothetical protein
LMRPNLQLSAGKKTTIRISNETGENPERVVVADAVRFVRKENTAQRSNGQ